MAGACLNKRAATRRGQAPAINKTKPNKNEPIPPPKKQERQRKIGVRAQAFRETPIFSFARCLKLCFYMRRI